MRALIVTVWLCSVPAWAWAQEAGVELSMDDTAVEAAAARMVQLRLDNPATDEASPPVEVEAPVPNPPVWRARVAVWGGRLQYTNPWALSAVNALTVVTGVDAQSGGVWAAAALSRTGLRYEAADFSQDAHLLGGWWRVGGLRLGASLGHLTTNATFSNGAWLGTLRGLWLPGRLGVDLGVATTVYPSHTVSQIDAQAVGVLSPRWEAAVGTRVIVTEQEAKPSIRAGVTWRPNALLEVGASGWFGKSQYAVDAAGLSVWSNDDAFTGGYRGVVSWQVLPSLALDAIWQHDIGNAQHGLAHDFEVLGATCGVRATF